MASREPGRLLKIIPAYLRLALYALEKRFGVWVGGSKAESRLPPASPPPYPPPSPPPLAPPSFPHTPLSLVVEGLEALSLVAEGLEDFEGLLRSYFLSGDPSEIPPGIPGAWWNHWFQDDLSGIIRQAEPARKKPEADEQDEGGEQRGRWFQAFVRGIYSSLWKPRRQNLATTNQDSHDIVPCAAPVLSSQTPCY